MNSRIGLVVFTGALALMVWAPPLLAGNHPLAALAVRSFFSRLCHQDPARSFLLNDEPAAVCVRCFGIYLGAFLGTAVNLLSSAERRMTESWARHILLGSVLLNVFDLTAERLGWHGNLAVSRFLLGIALGIAISVLLSCGTGENRGSEISHAASSAGLNSM
jgi:uncharacterized membrane protein